MPGEERRQQLLERTREALRAAGEVAVEAGRRGGPPRQGDLFVHPETAGQGVEWLVLGRRPGDPARLLVVPADVLPLAGSGDLEVPEGEPGGPLVLRCRFGTWVDEPVFVAGERTGAVGPAWVRRAGERRRAAEEGTLEGDPLAREVDADPEYEDWVVEVLEPARAALAALGEPAAVKGPSAAPEILSPAPGTGEGEVEILTPGPRPSRRRARRSWWPWQEGPYTPLSGPALAAAALLAVTVGLGGVLIWQHLRFEEERQAAEEQRRELEELQEALAIAAIQELSLGQVLRGSGQELRVPPTGGVMLSLIVGGVGSAGERYRLEVENLDSGQIWTGRGLAPTAPGEIAVVLRPSLLREGRLLHLRLLAETGGEPELLEEGTVRLVRE